MSFTEFSYQLMQAHDFSVLHKEKGCSVQVGGSDQMGNIMAGIDLIRRQKAAQLSNRAEVCMREDPAYGLTLPLLTTSTGAKFGKSAGNAVWISSTMLSDFDFYQYFLRSTDEDVERYLLALTLLPKEEVQQILSTHAENKAKRIAQIRLAEEMTELVRGEDALQRARLATQTLFESDIHSLTLKQVEFAFMNDPRLVHVPRGNTDILRLAADTKLVASRSTYACLTLGEARRLVQQGGGLYLNNTPVKEVNAQLHDSQLLDGRFIVMRAGRTNHKIVVFT